MKARQMIGVYVPEEQFELLARVTAEVERRKKAREAGATISAVVLDALGALFPEERNNGRKKRKRR